MNHAAIAARRGALYGERGRSRHRDWDVRRVNRPVALAAGLSGAVVSTGIIVTAGLAEIVAGSIAMGLGGYLAAKSEAEHYASEHAREHREVAEKPEVVALRGLGLSVARSKPP